MDDLSGSELGTKTYWDECYTLEIENFRQHGDTGEVWFGNNIMSQICNYLMKYTNEAKRDTMRLLDVGCGNGLLLIELSKLSIPIDLYGVDYSKEAIILAEEIRDRLELNINYQVCDFLHATPTFPHTVFDIVHDKGTYDAICLCPENARDKREQYARRIVELLAPDGIFVITSCNWTKYELLQQWRDVFDVVEEIPAPRFTFGGKVGSVVTSLVFRVKK